MRRVDTSGRAATRFLKIAGVALALAGAGAAPGLAMDRIEIEVDRAKLLKLPEGATTLIVGNPLVADVTVQRNQIMVLTAKAFGSTNLIALDAKGAIISESTIVTILPNKADQLTVLRGGGRETYSCNPECGSVAQLGDEDKYFKATIGHSRERTQNARTDGGGK